MYIYNITTNIEKGIEKEWLEWMQTRYIPEMLATKKFSKALVSQVLVEEETGGCTYSVQYSSKSREALNLFYKEDADRLSKLGAQFADKQVAFQTELKIVDTYSV